MFPRGLAADMSIARVPNITSNCASAAAADNYPDLVRKHNVNTDYEKKWALGVLFLEGTTGFCCRPG